MLHQRLCLSDERGEQQGTEHQYRGEEQEIGTEHRRPSCAQHALQGADGRGHQVREQRADHEQVQLRAEAVQQPQGVVQ